MNPSAAMSNETQPPGPSRRLIAGLYLFCAFLVTASAVLSWLSKIESLGLDGAQKYQAALILESLQPAGLGLLAAALAMRVFYNSREGLPATAKYILIAYLALLWDIGMLNIIVNYRSLTNEFIAMIDGRFHIVRFVNNLYWLLSGLLAGIAAIMLLVKHSKSWIPLAALAIHIAAIFSVSILAVASSQAPVEFPELSTREHMRLFVDPNMHVAVYALAAYLLFRHAPTTREAADAR